MANMVIAERLEFQHDRVERAHDCNHCGKGLVPWESRLRIVLPNSYAILICVKCARKMVKHIDKVVTSIEENS